MHIGKKKGLEADKTVGGLTGIRDHAAVGMGEYTEERGFGEDDAAIKSPSKRPTIRSQPSPSAVRRAAEPSTPRCAADKARAAAMRPAKA